MIVAAGLAYLLGSIPFALIWAQRFGTIDPRTIGSGNLGATNVARASGLPAGIAVLALDVAKGVGSVLLARHLSDQPGVPEAAGLAAIVGHVYPVWLRFRGGRGVATACGVFATLAPRAMLAALAVFALTAWLTRYISLASVMASLVLPPSVYVAGGTRWASLAAVAASALIVFTHRSNLVRLRSGREWRVGSGVALSGPVDD
jgi:glycerol-3-phosphate acyltransferase PlsY